MKSLSGSCKEEGSAGEGTWDYCPYHGSRFAASGEVLGGPAETRLKEIELGKRRKVPAEVMFKTPGRVDGA